MELPKKHGALTLRVAEKRDYVEKQHPKLSIYRHFDLLGLCRSSFLRIPQEPCRESPENLVLMRLTDEKYTDHPFYGTRQIRNVLPSQGYKVNRKRVRQPHHFNPKECP